MRQLNSVELNKVNGAALDTNKILTTLRTRLSDLGDSAKPWLQTGCEKGANSLSQLATSIPKLNSLYVGSTIASITIFAVVYSIKEL